MWHFTDFIPGKAISSLIPVCFFVVVVVVVVCFVLAFVFH